MKYGQFGTEPTYYTLYTCSKDNTHICKFIYKAFCMNTVYFTPKVPNLYLLRCRQYDGGIKLLDHLDTFKKWQIFDGKIAKFCQMPWPL